MGALVTMWLDLLFSHIIVTTDLPRIEYKLVLYNKLMKAELNKTDNMINNFVETMPETIPIQSQF